MTETPDIVERGHRYLSENAAESGADVLIAEMADTIESLRATNTAYRKTIDSQGEEIERLLKHRDTLMKAVEKQSTIALETFHKLHEAEKVIEAARTMVRGGTLGGIHPTCWTALKHAVKSYDKERGSDDD